MSQRCAWYKQGWEYLQAIYNNLVLLGQVRVEEYPADVAWAWKAGS
jgi:hypothetical protein